MQNYLFEHISFPLNKYVRKKRLEHVTQWIKVLAGPARYMERTNSSRLSFEFHMCSLARAHPHKS